MPQPIRLILALHNHQPIGNFDHVVEQSYEDSYRPFLDVLSEYPFLKIALHCSGALLELLRQPHPEYEQRLAKMAASGQLEILGGAFYEPILTMIPRRDRVGQIRLFSRYLQDRLGVHVRGMWVPERVWEPGLASDLAEAGMEFTLLDDFHFKNAGLADWQLHGYYLTEDEGRTLAIFPDNERLRYLMPFSAVHETIDYLRHIAEERPGSVVVFGDDGEKFGAWPSTKQTVYVEGWLRRFFDALVENRSWIHVCAFAEALEQVPATGRIYLPTASYREMTEWALPVAQQIDYARLMTDLDAQPDLKNRLKPYVHGGFWRNFKVKYPETHDMYARMMMASSRLDDLLLHGTDAALTHRPAIEHARASLYRAQCNCGYWHGAFGGAYLPHLRNAVFHHLIAADQYMDAAQGKPKAYVEASAGDFNFDGHKEISLNNDQLQTLICPAQGGHIYELDVKTIRHNLLATMTRRPEEYHLKVLGQHPSQSGNTVIAGGQVVFKQNDLPNYLKYDSVPRRALIDHIYPLGTTFDQVTSGQAQELGNFAVGEFSARLRKNPDRIQVQMHRDGQAQGQSFGITKGVTLSAASSVLEVAYLIEGLPKEAQFLLAVEINLAGLPAGADDRFFHDGQHRRLGQLGTPLDLHGTEALHLVDQWLGIDVGIKLASPAGVWAYPVASVSQSEGGFELVHQAVCVIPYWHVAADPEGRFSTSLKIECDTSSAVRRWDHEPAAAAS